MIIDASAVLAIFKGEPDARRFSDAIAAAPRCRMALPTWFETAINVDSAGDQWASRRLDDFLETGRIALVAFELQHALIARVAWQQYGRGRHPARLNYGDCMAYALAKVERDTLLYKGNDFAQTDIEAALKD